MTDMYSASIFSDTVIPRREVALIDFYKDLKERQQILSVEFDIEHHMVCFHVIEKRNQQ